MKRRLATIYAIFCTLLLAGGFLLVFYFAGKAGQWESLSGIIGLACGFILAPCIHELGHVCFALCVKMDCVLVKCFCFKMYAKEGKKRFAFASPFSPDQTQVMPQKGGKMQSRAAKYALGGLIVSGVFFTLLLAGGVLTACLASPSYELFGLSVYTGYLFLLNLPPFEYASGKTDTLVYRGIKKGYDAEKCMLSAMEIQGRLAEGKSYCEIESSFYFDLPQLCEDEPMYAVMLDLRYRYHLEKGDFESAADCLNRLALNEEYLSDFVIEGVAAELVYLHSLNGDLESAERSGLVCQEYLKEDTVTAKRILAAYSLASGKTEAVGVLLEQAKEALQREPIAGVRKFEEILLSRIIF